MEVALWIAAEPIQVPRPFLGFADRSVMYDGNFARWLEDPVIVFGEFPAALPEIDALVAEV